jgi:heat shock protein HtpX
MGIYKMSYFKTALLLAGLTALFGIVGFAIGGQQGIVTALGMAFIMNFITYWYSDTLVLRMYAAKPISSGDIHAIVRELANQAGLPMPKVFIIDSAQPNAFATGRNPASAAIAVTRGIITLLNPQELRGVLAHEMAHIKNHDTLLMTITATLAGALGMLTNFMLLFGGGRRDEEHTVSGLGALALAILAPIAAMLVQMAISRTREYAADSVGAELSRDPRALASALQKIENAAHTITNTTAEQNPATAHLFIINPLHGRRMDHLFSTHPQTNNRIQALLELARRWGK